MPRRSGWRRPGWRRRRFARVRSAIFRLTPERSASIRRAPVRRAPCRTAWRRSALFQQRHRSGSALTMQGVSQVGPGQIAAGEVRPGAVHLLHQAFFQNLHTGPPPGSGWPGSGRLRPSGCGKGRPVTRSAPLRNAPARSCDARVAAFRLQPGQRLAGDQARRCPASGSVRWNPVRTPAR
jgi:hypothetical protein